jgi:hypothetical protein
MKTLSNRICGFLLPLLLLLTLPALLQAQFIFTTNNGTITITGFTGSGAVVIPDTTNGYPVTVIAGDKGVFSSSAVTSVTIPNSVTTIGAFTFSSCTKLTNIVIPDSVVIVGSQAFSFCSSLTNAAFGSNVTSVGDAVFRACNNLIAITVSALNTNYSSVAGVLFNKNQTALVAYPPGQNGSYAIPGNVTSIGETAFETCAGLKGITLPNSVTNIGLSAFDSCSALTNLIIPPGVASIGEDAFYNCTSLSHMTIPNSVTNLGIYALESCVNLTNVTIGTGLTSIPDYLFYNCASLTTVTFGSGVTNIGYSAFGNCISLTNITLPKTITCIGFGAFADSCLISIVIPNTVTSIGEAAFWSCPRLTSVTIPNSVTSIGGSAFYYCTSLTSIYFQGNAPSVDGSVFESDNNVTAYYLPGTAGWDVFSADTDVPTALWLLPNPVILNNVPSFRVQTNGFGFTISWATNISIVVEASTNLANPVWQPVQTNTLVNGTAYFSDSQWTNSPARYYRLRSP